MTNTKTLAERLRDCGNDPMWADHAEVPKSWCLAAADALDRITPPDAGAGLVRYDPMTSVVEPDPDGEWVRYEDAKAAIAERERGTYGAAVIARLREDIKKASRERVAFTEALAAQKARSADLAEQLINSEAVTRGWIKDATTAEACCKTLAESLRRIISLCPRPTNVDVIERIAEEALATIPAKPETEET